MLEQKPLLPVVFPPQGGDRYKVRTGDSWDSIARSNQLDTWALIEFNFPVVKNELNFQTRCKIVNWLLHNHIGCTKSSDGKNYRFDSTDSPGYIYIPLLNTPPTYTHRVNLHFRSLSLTDIPFNTAFRNAQRVYAQYGIRIDFASGMSLGLPADKAAALSVVDGSCRWVITDGEYNEVHRLGGSLSSADILVCFVNRLSSGDRGCGGHAPNRPACIVAADGTQWTTAHEVGHVLLGSAFRPVHETSRSNLMFAPTSGITANPPTLTDAQVAQMKRSVCCVRL
jgi:hypothetical protein